MLFSCQVLLLFYGSKKGITPKIRMLFFAAFFLTFICAWIPNGKPKKRALVHNARNPESSNQFLLQTDQTKELHQTLAQKSFAAGTRSWQAVCLLKMPPFVCRIASDTRRERAGEIWLVSRRVGHGLFLMWQLIGPDSRITTNGLWRNNWCKHGRCARMSLARRRFLDQQSQAGGPVCFDATRVLTPEKSKSSGGAFEDKSCKLFLSYLEMLQGLSWLLPDPLHFTSFLSNPEQVISSSLCLSVSVCLCL